MFKRLPKGKNGGVQLLLIHNVEHLGKQGDIVEVKAGYALNYLMPQGLATVATDHHMRMVEKHREKLRAIELEKLSRVPRAGRRTWQTVDHDRGQRQRRRSPLWKRGAA